MARGPARKEDEESDYLRGENHAHSNGRSICEDEVWEYRGVFGRQSLLIGMLTEKHEETGQQAMERRERCSPVGLVNSSCSRDSDNCVACSSSIFAAFQKVAFEVLGLRSTELISRAHDVGAMCVLARVERYLLEHVEHLSRMTTTAQDDEQVNRLVLASDLRDGGILRVCEGGDDGLEMVKSQSTLPSTIHE